MITHTIPSVSADGQHWHPLTTQRFDSRTESDTDYQRLAVLYNYLAGRTDQEGNLIPDQEFLSEKELIRGVDHPLEEQNIQTRHRLRRKAELNPKSVDLRTDAEKNRDSIAQRIEDERVERLPASEVMLLQAEKQVSNEKQHRAIEQARRESLSTSRAIELIENLEAVSVYAKYDETVPGYFVDELEHLTTLLNRFGDVENISARFEELQQQMSDDVRVEESHSRAVVDRIQARTEMILAGKSTLDFEPVVYSDFLGRQHAKLTFNGESITIPFDQFDGRSESQLLNKFFNAGSAA